MGLFDALPAPKRPAEGEPEAVVQRGKSARIAEPEGKGQSAPQAPAAVPGGSARPPARSPLPCCRPLGAGSLAGRNASVSEPCRPHWRPAAAAALLDPAAFRPPFAQQQRSPPSPTWTRLKRRRSRSRPQKQTLARSRRKRSSGGPRMCRRRHRRRQQTRPAGQTTRCGQIAYSLCHNMDLAC